MRNDSTSVATPNISSPIDWVKMLLSAVILGLLVYAFGVQQFPEGLTPYGWLIGHWNNISNYSHGPLIPIIASFLLYWNVSHTAPADTDWRPYWTALGASGATLAIWMFGGMIRKEWDTPSYYLALRLLPISLCWQVWTLRTFLRGKDVPQSRPGIVLLVISMFLYYIGIKGMEPHLVVIAGVMMLGGMAQVLCGRDTVRLTYFPILFLLLMIPLNFLEQQVGFRLRMLVASQATMALNLIGIHARQQGSGIISDVFRFDVADPCSGIRSLMALTTVTAAYAYLTQRVQWKRWVLFLSAIPLAVLGNMARVVSIALVAQVYGQEAAASVYHDWSGFILFPVALGAMVLIGKLLNLDYRRLVEHWLQPPTAPARYE